MRAISRLADVSINTVSKLHGRCSEAAGEPVQLTSDGHRTYLEAIEGAFGADVDYAQLVKIYGAAPESAKCRYSPAECVCARKHRVESDPDPAHVNTSYVERQNLTMLMQMPRFTG